MIQKDQIVPIDKIVRKRRQERGETYIENLEETKDFDFNDGNKFKSVLGEFGGS